MATYLYIPNRARQHHPYTNCSRLPDILLALWNCRVERFPSLHFLTSWQTCKNFSNSVWVCKKNQTWKMLERIVSVPVMIYDKIRWFPNPGWFTIVLHASRFLANLATSPNAIDFAFHKSFWNHFVFSLRLNCDQVHAIFLASFPSRFPRFLRFYGVSLASKCSPWKPITFSAITYQGARNS